MSHLVLSSPLLSSLLGGLPSSPGVYIYKNEKAEIIYVGKAKNLKNRVRSYFQPIQKLGPKTASLVSQIANIEHISVQSEIESLLLEAKLIKKFRPKYNIISKDGKSEYYIHLSKGKFPIPTINHLNSNSVAGPFLNSLIPKMVLRQLRRIAPYCTTKHPEKPCFYTHLGLCDPDPKRYRNNIIKLKKLLKGEFTSVSRVLKLQMIKAAKIKNFEQAAELRDKLKNLEYLLQKPISADEYIVNPNLLADKAFESLNALHLALSIWPLARIEMYDIANLSGTAATGAMTVAINGQTAPREYRHFTIKFDGLNDVMMMKEMLERRLKRDDWPKPDLIVLDGGLPQLSIVHSQLSIPVVALAKKEEIIYFADGKKVILPRTNPGLQLLQKLRDEAHRFSRRLHHKHRSDTIK